MSTATPNMGRPPTKSPYGGGQRRRPVSSHPRATLSNTSLPTVTPQKNRPASAVDPSKVRRATSAMSAVSTSKARGQSAGPSKVRFDNLSLRSGGSTLGTPGSRGKRGVRDSVRQVQVLQQQLAKALSSQDTLNQGFVTKLQLQLAQEKVNVENRIQYLKTLQADKGGPDPLSKQHKQIALKNLEIDHRRVSEMPLGDAVEELIDVINAWERKQNTLTDTTLARFKGYIQRTQGRLEEEQSGAAKEKLIQYRKGVLQALADVKSLGTEAHRLAKSLLAQPDAASMSGFQEYGDRVDACVRQGQELVGRETLQAMGLVQPDYGAQAQQAIMALDKRGRRPVGSKGRLQSPGANKRNGGTGLAQTVEGELQRSRQEIEALQANIGTMGSFVQNFIKETPQLPLDSEGGVPGVHVSAQPELQDGELLKKFVLQAEELDQDVLRTREAIVFTDPKRGKGRSTTTTTTTTTSSPDPHTTATPSTPPHHSATGSPSQTQTPPTTTNLAAAANVTSGSEVNPPTPIASYPVTSVLDDHDRISVSSAKDLYDVDEVPLLEFLALERQYNTLLFEYEIYRTEHALGKRCISCDEWSTKLVHLRNRLKDIESKIGPLRAKELLAEAAKQRKKKAASAPGTPKGSSRSHTAHTSSSKRAQSAHQREGKDTGSSDTGDAGAGIKVAVSVKKEAADKPVAAAGPASTLDAAAPVVETDEAKKPTIPSEQRKVINGIVKRIIIDPNSLETLSTELPRLVKFAQEGEMYISFLARNNAMTCCLKAMELFLADVDIMVLVTDLTDRLLDVADVRVMLTSWASTLIPLLSRAMKTHFSKVPVLGRALSALGKVSLFPEVFRWFRRDDCIKSIVESMTAFKREKVLQLPGLTILGRLACNASFVADVYQAGCLAAVTAALFHHANNENIVMSALNVLLAFCPQSTYRDDICTAQFKEGSSITIPATAIRYHQENPEVHYRALLLVRTLAVTPTAREQLLGSGVLTPVITILEHSDNDENLCLTSLLCLRSLLQLRAVMTQAVQDNAIPAVLAGSRAFPESLPIQRACASIFHLLAQEQEYRAPLSKYGLMKELMSLLLHFSQDTTFAVESAATMTLLLEETENHNRVDLSSATHALLTATHVHMGRINVVEHLTQAVIAVLIAGVSSRQQYNVFDEVQQHLLKLMHKYPRHERLQQRCLAILRINIERGEPSPAALEPVCHRLVAQAGVFDSSESYLLPLLQTFEAIALKTSRMPTSTHDDDDDEDGESGEGTDGASKKKKKQQKKGTEDDSRNGFLSVLWKQGAHECWTQMTLHHIANKSISLLGLSLLTRFAQAQMYHRDMETIAAVDVTLKVMKRQHASLPVHQQAFSLFVGLVETTSQNARVLNQAKALPAILHTFTKHQNEYLHSTGIILLTRCSHVFINDGERFVNIENGVIHTVLQSTKEFIDNPSLCMHAVQCLRQYLQRPGPKSAFLNFEGPSILTAAIASNQGKCDVPRTGMVLIARLCHDDAQMQAAFLEAGVLVVMMALLHEGVRTVNSDDEGDGQPLSPSSRTTETTLSSLHLALLMALRSVSVSVKIQHLKDFKKGTAVALIGTLYTSMFTYIEEEDCVEALVGVLCDLCGIPEIHRALLMDHGVEALAMGMQAFPSSLLIQRACVTGLAIMVHDPDVCQVLTTGKVAGPTLQLLAQYKNKSAILSPALVILQALAEHSALNRAVLETPEAITILSHIMSQNTSYEALVVLGKLDLSHPAVQRTLLQGPGLQAVIEGMQQHVGHAQLQVECVRLLHQLAVTADEEMIQALIQLGALEAVHLAVIKQSHTVYGRELASLALSILGELAVSEAGAAVAIKQGYIPLCRSFLINKEDDNGDGANGNTTTTTTPISITTSPGLHPSGPSFARRSNTVLGLAAAPKTTQLSLLHLPSPREDDEDLASKMLHTIVHLPHFIRAIKVSTREDNVFLRCLVQMMQLSPQDLEEQDMALTILEALTGSIENCHAAVHADCMTVLYYLMRIHIDSKDIQVKGLTILRNLAQAGDKNRQRIRGDLFTETIDNAFKQHKDSGVFEALVEETRRSVAGYS